MVRDLLEPLDRRLHGHERNRLVFDHASEFGHLGDAARAAGADLHRVGKVFQGVEVQKITNIVRRGGGSQSQDPIHLRESQACDPQLGITGGADQSFAAEGRG